MKLRKIILKKSPISFSLLSDINTTMKKAQFSVKKLLRHFRVSKTIAIAKK